VTVVLAGGHGVVMTACFGLPHSLLLSQRAGESEAYHEAFEGTVRERSDAPWSFVVDGRALLPLFSDSAGHSLVKEETSKRLCPHVH